MRLMTRPLQRGILLAAIIVSAAASAATEAPIAAQAAGLSVRIAGNHFVDGAGRTVRLLGVNRSGTEYECMANNGFFDGPGDAASVAAMASWNIDAVRVPLNEDCWLGINGAPAAYSGTNYRNAIAGYVSRLHAAGMYAIVDLHWNAQGSLPADGRTGQGRPDRRRLACLLSGDLLQRSRTLGQRRPARGGAGADRDHRAGRARLCRRLDEPVPAVGGPARPFLYRVDLGRLAGLRQPGPDH